MTAFVRSLRSEWLKQRRGLVSWFLLGGAFFVPTIIFAIRLRRRAELPAIFQAERFWETLWSTAWESIAILILPLLVIVTTSWMTQLEYRNDAWKQLHATPQRLITIFLAKLVVILARTVQVVALINLAFYLLGVLPAVVFADVSYPSSPIPWSLFLERNLRYWVDILPIVALQYLMALRLRNILAPLAAGLAVWLFGLGAISWDYNYLVPTVYGSLDYLVDSGYRTFPHLPANIPQLATLCFVLLTAVGYWIYASKKERG